MWRHHIIWALALALIGSVGYAQTTDRPVNPPAVPPVVEPLSLPISSEPVEDTLEEGEYGQPMIFLRGGGSNTLTNLDEAGTADFDTGYNAGAGLGFQLNRWATLRLDYMFSRSQGRAVAGLAPIGG